MTDTPPATITLPVRWQERDGELWELLLGRTVLGVVYLSDKRDVWVASNWVEGARPPQRRHPTREVAQTALLTAIAGELHG